MAEAYIAGVAATAVTKSLDGTIRDNATRVALDAIKDAGLGREDIDGLFVTPPALSGPPGFMWSCTFAHHLGVQTKAQALVECGGMTSSIAVKLAVEEVRRGRVNNALVVASDRRVIDALEDFEFFLKQAATGLLGLYGPYDGVYGLGAPIPYYAMSAQRYMHEYDVSVEDLATVAVELRSHAVNNPRAEHRAPITVDDVLASKMISPPLRLLDCSSFASGAAAVVVTATPSDVKITAIGEFHEPAHFASLRGPLTHFKSATRAAQEAYAIAGKTPADIDVAEVYGVFTATELMLYEDLGFYDKGQAKRGGARTVFNPSGGRLSLGHPAGATPMLSLVEVTEQLQGRAASQVDDPKTALVHSEHGMLNGSMVTILEKS